MSELPIVSSCEGCGACCLEQESPPGYVLFAKYGAPKSDDEETLADWAIFQTLPTEARKKIDDYLAWNLKIDGRRSHPWGGTCIWFDWQTRRCSHYEYRPTVCREFEVGSINCKGWRKAYGIG